MKSQNCPHADAGGDIDLIHDVVDAEVSARDGADAHEVWMAVVMLGAWSRLLCGKRLRVGGKI